jgi:hypothetical protein
MVRRSISNRAWCKRVDFRYCMGEAYMPLGWVSLGPRDFAVAAQPSGSKLPRHGLLSRHDNRPNGQWLDPVYSRKAM